MNNKEQEEILQKAKLFFKNTIIVNHIKNTTKASQLKDHNINPFLVKYLAKYLSGDTSDTSIAKALLYPRLLATSITTSFGTNFQKFITEVLDAYGSGIEGIDVYFIDAIDKEEKYCHIKAGPQTINADDVETIIEHFNRLKRRRKTNNQIIKRDNLVIGVLYGAEKDLSSHYKKLANKHDYNIYVGQDFWHRLTGQRSFYARLIEVIVDAAGEADSKDALNKAVSELALDVGKNRNILFGE